MTKQQVALCAVRLAAQRGGDPRNTVDTQARFYRSCHWMLDRVEWDQSEKEWARMQGEASNEGKELQS
jgi:hypothetical protein